ncbi:MAG: hypothetical protein VW438_00010 [Euryarchaeota archaeon]|jgi:hypothetical protein
MSMSRKDYELIAAAFRRSARDLTTPERRLGMVEAIAYVSEALGNDNPRFDANRFLNAAMSEADYRAWMDDCAKETV